MCHQDMRKNIEVEGYPWMTLNSYWSMSSTLSNEKVKAFDKRNIFKKIPNDPICFALKDGTLNNLCLMQLECYNKEGTNVTCFTKASILQRIDLNRTGTESCLC